MSVNKTVTFSRSACISKAPLVLARTGYAKSPPGVRRNPPCLCLPVVQVAAGWNLFLQLVTERHREPSY